MESKRRAFTPRQTALIAVWLTLAFIGSFVVAMVLSGSVLALVA